jgi:hypothetical protein
LVHTLFCVRLRLVVADQERSPSPICKPEPERAPAEPVAEPVKEPEVVIDDDRQLQDDLTRARAAMERLAQAREREADRAGHEREAVPAIEEREGWARG